MALELAKFVSLHLETDSKNGARERMLGFTVSLPVDHVPPSSVIRSKWKRLSVDDTVESFVLLIRLIIHMIGGFILLTHQVGRELAEEINQALKKHGVEMRVFAVVSWFSSRQGFWLS